MVVQMALNKPCVVIAGAREGVRWQLYPKHRFLYTNGCCPNALYDGCWRSKLENCDQKKDGIPLCMRLIKPSMIVEAIMMYYEGGVL
jgi:hypothetical protein